MNLFTLAFRNLRRRKVRTLLTIAGVAIAVSVLFSLLAFNAGYEQELTKEVDNLGIHLLAVPKGCPYEAASMIIHGGVIPKYLNESDLSSIRNIPGVAIATPILMHQFLLNGTPHIVYGIESSDMLKLRPYWHAEGRFFSDTEKNVMVIGRGLAEKENLKVGQILNFGPKKEPFEIVGILDRTGGQEDEFHLVSLSETQRVFGKEHKVNAVAVFLDDITQISDHSDEIEKIPEVQVVTMTQVTGTIMNLVGSARILLFSLIAVAVVISACGISNTLLMSVYERTRELGMFKAIGASSTDIGIMILTETIVITTLGGIAGVGGALVGAGLIEQFIRGAIPYAPAGSLIAFDPEVALICIGFSVILGVICGLYPAYRSSRLSPIEAIRSEAV
ncbi:MAG: ABC transporter permease [Methanospirillum sp.]|uniref:ABC transporter permease n=1 Tax=Methanospirillum sp. TaxID=45200 RepID=UPI00237027C7|nr:ABC transporter permease [Methanospirillum sp.]MDD1729334.1 ABC transporter permease [Methanospirillum sp.]